MRGNFDAAFPARRTVIVLRAGVVEGAAIDGEMVVVKAFIERIGRGAGPNAVLPFGKLSAAAMLT